MVFHPAYFIIAMDRVVFLSSLSSVSPSNSGSSKSASFENRLHEPITLNPRLEYEMGLVDFICPDNYVSLFPDDPESGLDLLGYVRQDDTHAYHTLPLGSVTPSVPLCVDNLNDVVQHLNTNITRTLKQGLRGQFTSYFETTNFFSWHAGNTLLLRSVQDTTGEAEPRKVSDIFAQFGTRLADVLGFHTNTWYTLYHKGPLEEEGSYHIVPIPAPLPARNDGGVSCIMAYCDRIAPTSFGDDQVPILDIWKPGSSVAEKKRVNYVSMNTTQQIDSIAVTLRDQLGRELFFPSNNSDCFVSLHLRPKNNK